MHDVTDAFVNLTQLVSEVYDNGEVVAFIFPFHVYDNHFLVVFHHFCFVIPSLSILYIYFPFLFLLPLATCLYLQFLVPWSLDRDSVELAIP